MRQVQVYIEGKKIELFEDEQINVTSSVQNISDISKVFTDFSQSFTVPASPINNAIFQHFYQSDVDSTIDHNIRRSAIIEIDLTTFRRGKIQIEKANVKNGMPENYQLTFYGDVRTLKDRFGEDKLNQLNLTPFEFAFDGANILNRIIDLSTDYEIRYPLIASNRLWTYHHGSEDITTTAHSIKYNELFPAIKIASLFNVIQSQYNVTFQGSFLTDPKFTNAFLYCKNANVFSFLTETIDLDFDAKTNVNDAGWSSVSNQNAEDFVDLLDNTINVKDFDSQLVRHYIQINITSKSAAGTLYVDVYQNENYYQTLETTTTGNLTTISFFNTSGLNTKIRFKLKATASMNIGATITYTAAAFATGGWVQSVATITTNTTILSGNVNLSNTMPDMKVSDFFRGVLLQFNMTCIGVSENTFEILPLDNWYSNGAIVDITQYTDIDSIDVERIKLYKKISFKYQESESFVNRNYFKLANSEYGNLEYQFAYDGDEYTIESPFENLLFTRSTDNGGSYAILGYCLNESFNAYTPKPIILYLYGESDVLDHDIKFYNGTNHDNISTYALFGQDLTNLGTKYSLNFGAENSVIHLQTIQQGLYAQYYYGYLMNLFNLKNRLINVKTNLPISLLTGLQLNDRLIIRDKRYIINEMKSNLTTGEVNFSLYLDFRPLISTIPITIDCSEQCIRQEFSLRNKSIQATFNCELDSVTIEPNLIDSTESITICVPANTTGETRIITIIITYLNSDGSTQTEPFIIIQEPC